MAISEYKDKKNLRGSLLTNNSIKFFLLFRELQV